MNLFLDLPFSAPRTIIVLCGIVAIACLDIVRRIKHRPTHLIFATIFGTAVSLGLFRVVDLFVHQGPQHNSYVLALALLLVILGWKALFGPWEVKTKLAVLVTFIFWISLHLFANDTPEQNSVRLIAIATAFIPAIIWCILFLKYHRERIATVALLFLAGMLSTVPILFYDMITRRGVEMQFFFFRIKPENFNQTARDFVSTHLPTDNALHATLLATLFAFLCVGIIEEVSKYWVINKCGKQIFTSIDDVMQMSVMVAIGFAFAENVVNPVYFTAFVTDYLIHDAAPDVPAFLGNVLGRSVLTSMVHIVSTGVMGYFLGLAFFAHPVLDEKHQRGKEHPWFYLLHSILRMPEVSIFRVQMLIMGLLSAVLLHAFFNFLVTLPDIIPGNPQSVGELMDDQVPALIGHIPLLMIPAMLYVVGGFWLLTWLFMRKKNMAERGHRVIRETFVDIIEEE
jgi:RsiW-degrading membrane proteinase PrsW (M82 family)